MYLRASDVISLLHLIFQTIISMVLPPYTFNLKSQWYLITIAVTLALLITCSEVLCTGVVVARDVVEAIVVTMQGSCFRVVSSRDSALMNWGCNNT